MDEKFQAIQRPGNRTGTDPRLISGIPDDWATKVYALIAVEDPDNPGTPMWAPVELAIAGVPGAAGWGFNWGNNWGG